MRIKTNKCLVTALSKIFSTHLPKSYSEFKTEEINRPQISRFFPCKACFLFTETFSFPLCMHKFPATCLHCNRDLFDLIPPELLDTAFLFPFVASTSTHIQMCNGKYMHASISPSSGFPIFLSSCEWCFQQTNPYYFQHVFILTSNLRNKKNNNRKTLWLKIHCSSHLLFVK